MQAKLSVFYTVHAHKYTSTRPIPCHPLPSSLQCIVGTALTNRCVTSVLPCISLHFWDHSEYRFVLFHGSGKRQLSSNCNVLCVCVFQHIGLLQACIHRCTVCTGGEMWAPYLAWWGNELLRQDELYLLGSSLVCTCTCVCEPVCMCFCAPQLKTDHSGAVVHSRHRVCWQHNWLAWHFNSPLLWGDSILWPVSNRSC